VIPPKLAQMCFGIKLKIVILRHFYVNDMHDCDGGVFDARGVC